jgi:hypothetical protein
MCLVIYGRNIYFFRAHPIALANGTVSPYFPASV